MRCGDETICHSDCADKSRFLRLFLFSRQNIKVVSFDIELAYCVKMSRIKKKEIKDVLWS